MDYSKRLEDSVKNFEAETSKLAKINRLIQDTATLIDAINKEKATLEKAVAQISSMRAQIAANCQTLAEFAANEESARTKLLAAVHENILADSKVIIEKLSAPLNDASNQLAENGEQLNRLIETHQKSQEIFLANLETILIKYNTKNLEVYNTITGTLSNKIDVARDNAETTFNTRLNVCAQNISNLNYRLEQTTANLDSKIDKNSKTLGENVRHISEEVSELKKILPTLQYIKTAVSVAVGTGVLACALNYFLK